MSSRGDSIACLTMRLSDAGFHQRRTKALYPNHQLPPWLTEDVARDRSNRLLGLRDLKRDLLGAVCHPLSPLFLEAELVMEQS
jgi:hypothetical protein